MMKMNITQKIYDVYLSKIGDAPDHQSNVGFLYLTETVEDK